MYNEYMKDIIKEILESSIITDDLIIKYIEECCKIYKRNVNDSQKQLIKECLKNNIFDLQESVLKVLKDFEYEHSLIYDKNKNLIKIILK